MSAWLWKDGQLLPLNPAPDAEINDIDQDYPKRGYIRSFHVDEFLEVWIGGSGLGTIDPGPLTRYRFVVYFEHVGCLDPVFIEDMPDWLTFQPYLAAHVQLLEADYRNWERREEVGKRVQPET